MPQRAMTKRFDIVSMLILREPPEGEASPWSVWQRFLAIPALVAAVWSHSSIGLWCLGLIALVAVSVVVVPLALPRPRSTRSWAAFSALGEKVWALKEHLDVADGELFQARLLLAFATTTLIGAVLAAYLNMLWPTIGLAAVSALGKLAFQHHMALLFERQRHLHPALDAWVY